MWQELEFAFRQGFRSGLCRMAFALMWIARGTTETEAGYKEYTDIMDSLKEKIL